MKEVFMLEIMFTTSNLIKAHDKGGFTKKKNPLRYYINYIYFITEIDKKLDLSCFTGQLKNVGISQAINKPRVAGGFLFRTFHVLN